ncbi:XrtA/PEP-CTERM system TPR-repeat protein PrsT [Burkholderiaceae bacterium UC74_6]
MKKNKQILAGLAVCSALLLSGCKFGSAEAMMEDAQKSIEKGDRAAAIIQLKNALQKQEMSEARFLLARTLFDSGDIVAADIELKKTEQSDFPKNRLMPLRAKIMLARGDYKGVVDTYADTKLDVAADQSDLTTSVASARMRLDQRDLALATVEKALQQDPNNVRANVLKSRLIQILQGNDASATFIAGLTERSPKILEYWEAKGELMASQRKFDEALAAYRMALTIDARRVSVRLAMVTILLDQSKLPEAQAMLIELRKSAAGRRPNVEFLAAALALERNLLPEANERIQRVLRAMPEDPRVLEMAAKIEARTGSLVEADAHLGKVLSIMPDNARARLLQAQVRLRLGDAAKALATVQPLLDADKPIPEALSLAVEAQSQMGDVRAAEKNLQSLAAQRPNDSRVKVALAMSSIKQGRVEQGIASLRALSSGSDDAYPDLALLNLYGERRDFDKALETLKVLDGKMPGKPVPAMLRGRIDLARGRSDLARQDFEAALKIDANYYPAISALNELDLADKTPAKAVARLQRFLDANPKALRARMAMIRLREQSGVDKKLLADQLSQMVREFPTEAGPRIALIDMQLRRNEPNLARSAAEDAVAAMPNDADVTAQYGRVLALAGQFDRALSMFNKVVVLRPNAPQSYMALAELYAGHREPDNVVKTLNRLLAIEPDYAPAQAMLISTAVGKGNKAEALRVAQSVKGGAISLALAGDVEMAFKSYDAAAAQYRAALTKSPATGAALKLHGALIAAGKPAEAAKVEADWVARNPKDAGFLMGMGDSAVAQNNLPVAEAYFRKALELAPNSTLAMNNLAWVLNQQGKPGALELALKVVKAEPDDGAALDTLAGIYAKAGQYDKAIETQKLALANSPETPVFRLALARYYLASGQKDAAKNELKRLSGLGDKWPQQPEVKKLLATLGA